MPKQAVRFLSGQNLPIFQAYFLILPTKRAEKQKINFRFLSGFGAGQRGVFWSSAALAWHRQFATCVAQRSYGDVFRGVFAVMDYSRFSIFFSILSICLRILSASEAHISLALCSPYSSAHLGFSDFAMSIYPIPLLYIA